MSRRPLVRTDLPLELKVILVLAGLGAVLLVLTGVSVLSQGGTAGLLLGGSLAAVAIGQLVAFVSLYRQRAWAWNWALALLVSGGLLQAATGDFLGTLVSVFIAGYLYTQREAFGA